MLEPNENRAGRRRTMRRITVACLVLAMIACDVSAQTDKTEPAPQLGKSTLKDVIRAMTLEEKARFVVGTGFRFGNSPAVGETQEKVPGAAGATYAIPRLAIPSAVLAH